MKTLEDWKKELKKSNCSKNDIQTLLDKTLGKIAFLESIYQTDGKYNWGSSDFKDSAIKERDAFCQLSSACHSLLREK